GKDFGERIKNYRIKKGLSQENIATSLGKSKAIVSRYEKGEVLPDARDISIICEELGIYEADLYENDTIRTTQHNKSKNPFGTDKLYVYFNAYNFRTRKFAPDKYILELEQKQNICKAKFVDYHDKRIYSEGYLICNDEIAFAVMENYRPTSTRIDIPVIEINICNGTDGLMLGGYFGTNAKCEPSLRKCYVSKKNVDFTDEMFEQLKLNENEQEILNKQNALYLDIFNI
ncbi:MAG: helix-turn-helix transcriptional regulator, partial [Clostridia bacterium]|nr:helix-turn-helix transcriptional regulator [Clostridia bacterium]